MMKMNGNTGIILSLTGAILSIVVLGEARHIHTIGEQHQVVESIPAFLLRMYDEMGREKFQQTWKEFNNRNPDQQDAFLMEDMSDEELDQLGTDFENFAMALSADPKLMELYGDFERNLSIVSFMEMDKKLMHNQAWWGRIKRFLYRKLKKLAQEMIMQEAL
ncbi:hypothetical protein Ocin01_04936 [Orchesella cincta]|uniref:Uncharacterized protein n=1 Tax=Orchesella cincta TaxID=48709 RepID=A0A1D2N914_ORCCI|nr:hypothetical protein Ocin01_04936 [Orchesella cincta]